MFNGCTLVIMNHCRMSNLVLWMMSGRSVLVDRVRLPLLLEQLYPVVLVREQVVVREEDVPVVVPHLRVLLEVDVVVQAVVQVLLAARQCKGNARARHVAIVCDDGAEALLGRVPLDEPLEQAHRRRQPEVVDELVQLLRVPDVVAPGKNQWKSCSAEQRPSFVVNGAFANRLMISAEFFVRSSQSAFSRRAVHRKSIGVCSRKRDMMLRSHLAMWFLRDSPGLRSGSCDTRSSRMNPDEEVDACAFTRNPSSFSTQPRSTSARRTVWNDPRRRNTRWCLVASCTFFRSSLSRSALIQLFLYGLMNFTVAVSGPRSERLTLATGQIGSRLALACAIVDASDHQHSFCAH
uniref:Uncharacterized protein n=1 Tax=Anopheles atroparvus TaxID=41427 RepID=A0A182J967_ANOAO